MNGTTDSLQTCMIPSHHPLDTLAQLATRSMEPSQQPFYPESKPESVPMKQSHPPVFSLPPAQDVPEMLSQESSPLHPPVYPAPSPLVPIQPVPSAIPLKPVPIQPAPHSSSHTSHPVPIIQPAAPPPLHAPIKPINPTPSAMAPTVSNASIDSLHEPTIEPEALPTTSITLTTIQPVPIGQPQPNITRENILQYYEYFLKKFHQDVVNAMTNGLLKDGMTSDKTCRMIDHLSKFETPPRNQGRTFHPFELYEYAKRMNGVSRIPTWSELAREMGFVTKGTNIAIRVKEWMSVHHLGPFLDYLMGIPNVCFLAHMGPEAAQTLEKRIKDEEELMIRKAKLSRVGVTSAGKKGSEEEVEVEEMPATVSRSASVSAADASSESESSDSELEEEKEKAQVQGETLNEEEEEDELDSQHEETPAIKRPFDALDPLLVKSQQGREGGIAHTTPHSIKKRKISTPTKTPKTLVNIALKPLKKTPSSSDVSGVEMDPLAIKSIKAVDELVSKVHDTLSKINNSAPPEFLASSTTSSESSESQGLPAASTMEAPRAPNVTLVQDYYNDRHRLMHSIIDKQNAALVFMKQQMAKLGEETYRIKKFKQKVYELMQETSE